MPTIVFSIVKGNDVSIEWQGDGGNQAHINDEKTMKDAVKASSPEIKNLIELFSVKGAYLTVDENYNDLCYQHSNPIDDSTCANLAKSNSKVKYYKTLEDIIDMVIYSHNKVDKEVSPYNSKPLFTREADAAGQIAILIVGNLEVKIVAYDKDGKKITEANVKGN